MTKVKEEPSDTHLAFESRAKEKSSLGDNDDFIDLKEFSSQTESGMNKRNTSKECLPLDPNGLRKVKSQIISSAMEMQMQSTLNFLGTENDAELKGIFI